MEKMLDQFLRVKTALDYIEFVQSGPEPGENGWLLNYAVILDMVYGSNRYFWWMNTATNKKLPETPIPGIDWCATSETPAKKHLEKLVSHFSQRGFNWNGFEYLMDEIGWALGTHQPRDEPPKELYKGSREYFMTHFDLSLFYKYPFDYFGDMISESKGSGKQWNPTAFFPTPMSITLMMVSMTHPVSGDWKKDAVCTASDPCVGTGRMLLAQSAYCLRLSGQDIDMKVLKACRINLALYVPWAKHCNSEVMASIKEVAEQIEKEKKAEQKEKASDAETSHAVPRTDKKGQYNLF